MSYRLQSVTMVKATSKCGKLEFDVGYRVRFEIGSEVEGACAVH